MGKAVDGATNPNVKVLKAEMLKVYRQTVSCPDQDNVPLQLLEIHSTIVTGKFTGKVTLNCSMGGVVNIMTEEVGKLPLDDGD